MAGGLGPQHFAFYRACFEGLDTADLTALADKYLGCGRDARHVRQAFHRLRDELLAVSRRTGDADAEKLLYLSYRAHAGQTARRRDAPAPGSPSLDAFRDMVDPDGVYGEEELAGLFEERFPAKRAPRRDRDFHRLLDRRVAALSRIQAAVVNPPRREDLLAGWIAPALAERLACVGIHRLGQLMHVISVNGFLWHKRVPKVGASASARLIDWLKANAQTLGALPPTAFAPLRSLRRTELFVDGRERARIGPIETFRCPALLDGLVPSSGTKGNRVFAPARGLAAERDIDAIHLWLADHGSRPHTFRAYRTQAERVMLWAVIERGKAFSALDAADLAHFRAFLSAPGSEWIGPPRTPRWSPRWRPFNGPLSTASQATAWRIVNALFAWLVEHRYLQTNPAAVYLESSTATTIPSAESSVAPSRTKRATDMWRRAMDFLEGAPSNAVTERERFLAAVAAHTVLRLDEMACVTLADLIAPPHANGHSASWTIVTRTMGGEGRRYLIMPPAAVDALRRYLRARCLDPDPEANPPGTPLIARLDGRLERMTSAGIALAYKRLFTRAAAALAPSDPEAGRMLQTGTATSLRNLF